MKNLKELNMIKVILTYFKINNLIGQYLEIDPSLTSIKKQVRPIFLPLRMIEANFFLM